MTGKLAADSCPIASTIQEISMANNPCPPSPRESLQARNPIYSESARLLPHPFCYYMPPGLRAQRAAAGPLVPEFLISRESYHGRKIQVGCEVFARNDS